MATEFFKVGRLVQKFNTLSLYNVYYVYDTHMINACEVHCQEYELRSTHTQCPNVYESTVLLLHVH